MKKVLWISPYAPYDTVAHAGGKTHNYYLKYFHKSGHFDIHLISLAIRQEEQDIDLDAYGISNDICYIDGNFLKNLYRMLYNVNSLYNKNHQLCQTILAYQFKALKKAILAYAESNVPDIVIMQWTGAGFLQSYVRQLFPDAYTVIIEEDVTFLGYERRFKKENNQKKRNRYEYMYKHLKEKELSLLSQCNLAVVNNEKDKELLVSNGIAEDSIYVTAPYYKDYSFVQRDNINLNVIFYGVMSREENHRCAMWFVDNVLPGIAECGSHFEIIGGNPREELKRLECENIHVRGYVEDVTPYFGQCLCMAAPLELGAGIKVKILEGLSSGIPVLTNEVGIEGIPAKAGEEFYYCNTAEDYINAIKKLADSRHRENTIGNNAKRFMKETYNLDLSLDGLINRLLK